VVRLAGRQFIDNNGHWLNRLHLKVLTAIERCRTAALGGHVDRCTACGHQAISYNSCRNRHCPRCQANARDRWIDARSRDLLAVAYAHVVFTLPHELAPLAFTEQEGRLRHSVPGPAPRLSSKSPGIPSDSAPTSDSSVCFTHGTRSSNIILISTASFRPEASLRTGADGSPHSRGFCCLSLS
jgi:transposase-like zinc-binding protein